MDAGVAQSDEWLTKLSTWNIGDGAEVDEFEEWAVRKAVVTYARKSGRRFRMKSHPSGGSYVWREA